jgi:hypothetical protein
MIAGFMIVSALATLIERIRSVQAYAFGKSLFPKTTVRGNVRNNRKIFVWLKIIIFILQCFMSQVK